MTKKLTELINISIGKKWISFECPKEIKTLHMKKDSYCIDGSLWYVTIESERHAIFFAGAEPEVARGKLVRHRTKPFNTLRFKLVCHSKVEEIAFELDQSSQMSFSKFLG